MRMNKPLHTVATLLAVAGIVATANLSPAMGQHDGHGHSHGESHLAVEPAPGHTDDDGHSHLVDQVQDGYDSHGEALRIPAETLREFGIEAPYC